MNLKLPDLENPGSGLGEVLSQLAERLAGRIRSLPRNHEKNVHDLRLCAKKMRSLLRLARPAVGKKNLSRLSAEIRDLKNAFAGSRDIHVMRSTIANIAEGNAELAQSLVHEKKDKPLDLPLFLQKAEALCRKVENLDLSSISRSKILEQAKKTYRKARKLRAKCQDTPKGELMHKWRKRVKDLQYQSQALDIPPHGVGRLADKLGEYNDLEVLSRFLRKRSVSEEFRSSLKAARRVIREGAFEAAEKVFEEKPGIWQEVAS